MPYYRDPNRRYERAKEAAKNIGLLVLVVLALGSVFLMYEYLTGTELPWRNLLVLI